MNTKLHNAQDAIKQAIEGGYYMYPPENCNHRPGEHNLLDPLFWKTLQKARGWGNVVNGVGPYDTKEWGDWMPLDSWGWFAHQWLETRLSNGDETKFWESLP